MKLEHNKTLINQLIPALGEEDFERIFAEVTQHMSKSSQFLLKMELRRLASPCQRGIDLRGKVDGECFEYNDGDLIHYLDDDALATFKSALALYNGYRVGVFEEVTNAENSYRAKQQREAALRLNEQLRKQQQPLVSETPKPQHRRYLADEIALNDYHSRAEERLKISLTIKIRLSNGRTIHCHTIDISLRGVKIKLPERYEIEVSDTLGIHFVALTQEYDEPGINREISYRVINKEVADGHQTLSLAAIHKEHQFESFLTAYLAQQRPHCKVDAEHLFEAIKMSGYQQLHFSKLNGLPLFFSPDGNSHKATIALINTNNRSLLEYWEGHNKLQRICGLFSPARLQQWQAIEQVPAVITLYCFTHIAKGKRFFYSATFQELQESGLTDQFFAFGAHKPSWRVYQFYYGDLEPTQWQPPLLLPPHLDKSTPLSNEQLSMLQSLQKFGYLVDITDPDNSRLFQQRPLDKSRLNELRRFGHSGSLPPPIQLIEIEQIQQRRENRFSYQTPVILNHDQLQYSGATKDFSIHGLQLSLTKAFKGQIDSRVILSLPGLQKVSKTVKLDALEYQVVHIEQDQKVLRLVAPQEIANHQGVAFFRRLINSNADSFSPQLAPPPALAKSLNLLLSSCLCTLPCFIAKERLQFEITKLAKPYGHNPLHNLFAALSDDANQLDISPLARPDIFKHAFVDPLRTMDRLSPAHSVDLFLQLTTDKNNNYQCISKLASDLDTAESQRQFIHQAQQAGQFYAIKVILNKTIPPSNRGVADETMYAAQQSLYRTRKAQDELDSVLAVAELLDISQEVMRLLEG